MIIDDCGQIWSSTTRELGRTLHADLAPAQLCEYVIRNLGFVRIAQVTGGVRIYLRPEVLSPVAYATLMYWLADHPQRRMVLSTFDGGWQNQIVASPAELRQRLNDCMRVSRWRSGKHFSRTPIAETVLSEKSPVHRFRTAWDKIKNVEIDEISALCSDIFAGRYTVTVVTDQNEFVIAENGYGYAAYSSGYMSRCKGSRLEDDPDMEYGQWVALAYREALERCQPILEDVDVTISGSGAPSRRVRYQRIIAPFTDAEGRQYVISGSELMTIEPHDRATA